FPVTSGTVTFKEGNTVLANAVSLNSSGQASFNIATLAVGPHTITASFGLPPSSSSSISLTVISLPALSPTMLQHGTYGASYPNQTITATEAGYSGPFTYDTKNVNLPTNMSLAIQSNGVVLSGTPTSTGSSFSFTVTVTVTGHNVMVSQSYTLTVDARPLTITANSTSKTYGQTVTFAGTEFSVADPTTTPATGLVNGDTVSQVTLQSDGAGATATVTSPPAQGYRINASLAVFGTGSASNYNITYDP